VGGSRPARLPHGYFIEPTIFVTDNTTRIAREEIFGPIVACIPFKSEADAVRIANDTPYGLAAAVWSRDIFRCLRVVKAARRHRLGRRCSRDGVAGRGIRRAPGRELGLSGAEEFLETKQVHIN
jgi:betaine-aldehyde dehydrogenase